MYWLSPAVLAAFVVVTTGQAVERCYPKKSSLLLSSYSLYHQLTANESPVGIGPTVQQAKIFKKYNFIYVQCIETYVFSKKRSF